MMKQKGSILIFTLWVLVILVLLSILLSRRASRDITMAKYESNNMKATYLARAAVMKMLAELSKDKTPSYDSLNENWNNPEPFSFANGTVFYSVSDENRRLNLNNCSQDELTRLGINSTVAGNILAYKNNKTTGVNAFEYMEELFLVDGMTQEIYSQIKDLVTIYRGNDAKVNINTASEKVLYAIIGDEDIIPSILEYRKEGFGPDGEEGTDDDGVFTSIDDANKFVWTNFGVDISTMPLVVKSDVFIIWADATFSEDKKIFKSISAVVNRSGKIYNWKEY